MARTKEPAPRPSTLSKEYVSDSSEDEVDRPVGDPAGDNGQISTEESDGHESSASSEEELLPEIGRATSSKNLTSSKTDIAPSIAAKTKKSATPVDSSTSTQTSKSSKGSRPAVVAAIPPDPFQPPRGFAEILYETSDASLGLEVLSNVGDKQLWHIVAPSTFPISSLKEFSMTAASQGQSILSHQGRQYGISKTKTQALKQETVLRLAGASGKFDPIHADISQSYQIYEMPTDAPSDDTDVTHQQFTVTKVVPGRYAKPVRQQPPALRMRYRPFGTERKTMTESGDEEHGFRMPRQLPSPPIESPKKKRKKQSKASTTGEELVPIDIDQTQASAHQNDENVETSVMTETPPASTEITSKAEKKARKAEKEAKKKKKRDKDESLKT